MRIPCRRVSNSNTVSTKVVTHRARVLLCTSKFSSLPPPPAVVRIIIILKSRVRRRAQGLRYSQYSVARGVIIIFNQVGNRVRAWNNSVASCYSMFYVVITNLYNNCETEVSCLSRAAVCLPYNRINNNIMFCNIPLRLAFTDVKCTRTINLVIAFWLGYWLKCWFD